MCKGPDRREFGRADDAKDLCCDPVRHLLRCRWKLSGSEAIQDNDFGPRIHEPHADRVAAKAKKRHVPKAEDPAVPPDQIHRQSHKTQTQCLAKRLHKTGRNHPDPEPFGQDRDANGKQGQHRKEHQHRWKAQCKWLARRPERDITHNRLHFFFFQICRGAVHVALLVQA